MVEKTIWQDVKNKKIVKWKYKIKKLEDIFYEGK